MLDERANLAGRTAFVVGGGGGIGAAVSLALGQAGVDVALCDVDRTAMDETSAKIAAQGRRVFALEADATDASQLAGFYDAAAQRFERLDILVNVVGGVRRRDFLDGAAEECAADIHRNFGYVIESIRHALPLIRAGGGGGSIINFTTIEAHRGAAMFSVYAGAKAGLTNFSRALAVELGAERIRVNCIAPDTTPSKGNLSALPPEQRDSLLQMDPATRAIGVKMYVPMKAPPPATALADGVLFLASDLAAYITGVTLHIDGGAWAASGFLDWPCGDRFSPTPLAGSTGRFAT